MKLTTELKTLLKDKRIQSYGMEGGWINDDDSEEFTIYLKSGYHFNCEESSCLHTNDYEEIIWSLKNDIVKVGE